MEVRREDMILHGPWRRKVVWRYFKGLLFEPGIYAIFCERRERSRGKVDLIIQLSACFLPHTML